MNEVNVLFVRLLNSDNGIITREPELFSLPKNSTVKEALKLIGLDEAEAQALLAARNVAIFGKYALPDTVLFENDRIEVLDALRFDPMESRRRRAEHKKHVMPGQKKRDRRSGKPVEGKQS